MTFKFGGSGGGGGVGDTYTASTATAKNVIEAGKSYALTSDGGIVTPPAGSLASVGGFTTTDFMSNFENSVSIYGDVFLPDAASSGAYFVCVADAHSPQRAYIFVNKNGAHVESGGDGVQFLLDTGWDSVGNCSVYLIQYGETTDNWYYGLMGMKYASNSWRSGWYTFGVAKGSHQILNSSYANPYRTTWDSWDDGNSSNVLSSGYMIGNSNNKMLFSSLRGGTKLIRARGNSYDDDHEVYVETANLEANTSSNTYNMYTSSSGSLTITPTEDGHCAFFKVDDANGKFIFLYTKDGDGGFSYYHGSTPASGSTTYSSEIDVSGTLGSNMQYAHFIATSNPLVYYATYLDSSTTIYYQKITFASDLTSASMATMGSFTVPGGYGSFMGGTSRWARNYHSGTYRNNKLNIPGDETLLIWGSSYPDADTGRTLLFPASGTPSDGGVNTINSDFETAQGGSLTLTLSGDQKHIIAHQHGQSESEGYEMVSAQKYAPYKHTSETVAIARSAGNVGDTINIDLKTGDTATAALSTDFYVTKESMVYPLKVAGSDSAFTTAIKSVQRGTGYSSTQSTQIAISSVNRSKSQLVLNGWNSSQNKGVYGVLSSGSQITVYKSNSYSYGYSYAWEVVEYV
tara:strand:- start:220 stop:2106 length:1887 start_codon:yes stop_codon:yes gene_type:complete